MKSAVLLSGSLGMGHDVLAEACTTSLTAAGWSAHTLDAMRLLGKGGGSAGEAVFRSMLAVPGLYDAFHFAALRTGSRLAMLADAARPAAGGAAAAGLPRCAPGRPGDLGLRHRRVRDEQPGQPVPGHAAHRLLHRRDAAPAVGAPERGPVPGHRGRRGARGAPVPAGRPGDGGPGHGADGVLPPARPGGGAGQPRPARARALRAADVRRLGPRAGRGGRRGARRRGRARAGGGRPQREAGGQAAGRGPAPAAGAPVRLTATGFPS